MKAFSTLIIFFSFYLISLSQNGMDYIPSELLIQFNDEAAFESFSNNHNKSFSSLKYKSLVSKDFNMHLYSYPESQIDKYALLENIQNQEQVSIAGFNFRLQYRSLIPDDTFYGDQWNMDRIEAPEAWELTTNGKTVDGEDIVIALLEGGDIDHEDIEGNIWLNKDEIPDDGIDNDSNGYIDDYYGVNVVDSTDIPIVDNHGTSVMGLMGAKGNNQMGIAGVNWNAKIMIVSHDLSFAKIIEAYEYVYKLRKAWNDSNGAKGAFVVATNGSFGKDNQKPEDNPFFPFWCSMYDQLGEVGVLSASATTNSNISIDNNGDMPSFCSSDYLIAVTETDISDNLDAAYSQTHVDLAAPGKNVQTLKVNNSYGNFSGTSAATPMVSGTIGLMYSLPCLGLSVVSKENPAQTALLIKQLILDSTDELTDLLDKTVSGGRLNLFNAMSSLQDQFGSHKGTLEVTKIFPNPTLTGAFQVEYKTPEFAEYKVKVYNPLGQLIFQKSLPEVCAPKYIDIDLGRTASGIYFLSIENASDLKTAKFSVF